ncbi:MAG: hypothetical protein KDB80_14755 [Planctomycetes bacterium]|nr:hypothetical protein [Planctomycetota bacterium]
MKIRALAAGLLFLTATSCALVRSTENQPIDPAIVRQFQVGVTTAPEVVAKLGAPSQIVELGERSAYRYGHTVTKGAALILIAFNVGNSDSRADRLWVFFDRNDVLTHVGATFESHRPQYAMPWEDVHESADDAAADAGRPGLEP